MFDDAHAFVSICQAKLDTVLQSCDLCIGHLIILFVWEPRIRTPDGRITPHRLAAGVVAFYDRRLAWRVSLKRGAGAIYV